MSSGPCSQTRSALTSTSQGHRGGGGVVRFSGVFWHVHSTAEALSNLYRAHKTARGNIHNLYDSLIKCEVASLDMFENKGIKLIRTVVGLYG